MEKMSVLRVNILRTGIINHQKVIVRNRSSAAVSRQSYVHGPSSLPFIDLTVGQVLERNAKTVGDKEAIVVSHDGIRKTYQQLSQDVDDLSSGLLCLGLKPGDRLGIWGPNTYEWVLAYLAAGTAGFILVNINPAYQPKELAYCLQKVGVKAVIAASSFKTQDYYQMITNVIPEILKSTPNTISSQNFPNFRMLIMMKEGNFPGANSFSEVLQLGRDNRDSRRYLMDLRKKIQFDSPFNIQFTSGTTGSPKGATLTHHNVVNNGFFVGHRIGYHLSEHRICLSVPLHHCFGCVLGLTAALLHKSCLVLPSLSFKPQPILEAIEKEKCTSIYGTPTMYIDMLNYVDFDKHDYRSIETGLMSGAPCPEELLKAVREKLHAKKLAVAYGSTETSPIFFMSLPGDSMEKKVTTVGAVGEHCEVKVVDADGNIVPRGEPGECLARGYVVMRSYWNDHEKTKEAITEDRWYKTGDVMIMDEDGYGKIVGRMKDMVIRGGENIYPREIEEFLFTHPSIAEVQVIGLPDSRMGEELCTWIRLKPNKTMTEQDVRDFCKGNISHYKIPRYIEFVESFPMTMTGKVQKFKMREIMMKNFQSQKELLKSG